MSDLLNDLQIACNHDPWISSLDFRTQHELTSEAGATLQALR